MWITDGKHGSKEGVFIFKKSFFSAEAPKNAQIKITADTKYRLYINGTLVLIGPCKRGEFYTYYDTVDISPYLKKGENEIYVSVLHLAAVGVDPNQRTPYNTLLRGTHAALAIEGNIEKEKLEADASWLVSFCPEIKLLPPYPRSMAGEFEAVDYNSFSRDFAPAIPLTAISFDAFSFHGETLLHQMMPSPIPPLTYIPKSFTNRKSISGKNTSVVLDAGAHSTGAVRMRLSGKKGTVITLTYAECFWKKRADGTLYKEMRDDETGFIDGSFDKIVLDGAAHVFETFFWRCFRYIEVKINGEADISDIEFFEMRYPLELEAEFKSSDPDAEALWNISIRTLNNCMHDSFEDCPYFEQLQYVMDSRLQALFLRQLTPDRRLIKKCIDDFNEGRFPDGMIPARTPSIKKQRIHGFALHYIFMVHDHMLYEMDKARISDLIPTVDGVLRWFEKRQKNGIVGPLGEWIYVDWVKTWTGGVPTLTGSIAVYNFMLVVAYENASELAAFADRKGLSEEYKEKAENLRLALKAYFYDTDKRLFRDSEENLFSLHSQIWAVLADIVTGKEATDLLQRAYDDKELPVCSYSMMFFVFRAYEKAGLYHLAYKMLDKWRIMINKHCTTWVEDDVGERSECHGWGSLPIYEFSACILGVKPTLDGVTVKPYVYANDFAKGSVISPIGKIYVDWKKENDILTLKVNAPEKVKLILPDSTEYFSENGIFTCRV